MAQIDAIQQELTRVLDDRARWPDLQQRPASGDRVPPRSSRCTAAGQRRSAAGIEHAATGRWL